MCGQKVAELPALQLPADLDAARRAADDSRRSTDTADTQHRAAEREHARGSRTSWRRSQPISLPLATQLDGQADAETARGQLDEVESGRAGRSKRPAPPSRPLAATPAGPTST